MTADSLESAPATSTLNIPVAGSASIGVVKSSATVSVSAAGQVVPYTFTVTNTGNATLTGITVSDPMCAAAPALTGGDTNADGKLQLSETWVYTCSHTVTQVEVDVGGNLSNTVTADSVESPPATSTLNIPITQSPSIHVVKSSTTATATAAGQVVPYTFTVTNTGNVTLTGITIADPSVAPTPALSGGDTNADSKLQLAETWTYACSHTVTQAEVDAGGNLSNTVTVDSIESAPATSTLNIPITQTPSIHVVKSSTTATVTAAGQVVPYTFTVTNTGNVTLTGITISDPKCAAAPVLSAGDGNADGRIQLAETWVYGCSHTVTQAEVDAGGNLSNTVTVDSVESAPATSTLNIPVAQTPSIHVVKSSTTVSVTAAGQVVPYTFTVTNTGNVTLTGITITDPKCAAAPVLSAGDGNADGRIQLAETWVYGCSHTVTQAEVDAGGNLSNTVTVDSVESAPATSTLNIPVAQSPSIHVVKSSTTVSVTAAAQVVPYTFTVTNTGNVTLTGITVSDPKCDSAPTLTGGDTNADSKLQLSETWVYACSHTVTQAEVDAGGNLSNTVTADSVESAPATSSLNIPVVSGPAIAVVKSSSTVSVTAAGQVVPYTFTVTNTGNVTLTGITVSDPMCGAAPTLSSGDTNADSKLQLAETWVYGCSHTVTQAEVDAGGNLSNTVTVDSVESAPATSTLDIPVAQSPSIHVVKSSSTVSVTAAGQVVPYTFTVTNTGNVTLTGITVSDPKCAAAPTLTAGDANADSKLQLAETWVYGCSHTVTQAEVDAGGNLSNTVTVDSVESAPATSTLNIPVAQSPSIHVVKSSTTVSVTAAGQVVPYTFTVTNTGNVTLTGITISDPNCGAAPTLSGGDTNVDSKLQLAETWVYGCSRTVTQAEVDAGGNLSNTVTVDSVESAPATSTLNIPIAPSPSIHVVKSSTTATVTAAGQVVPYTFTVTNTGNLTLTGITVADPKCNAAPTLTGGDTNVDSKLQLAETWTYACSRTVTQAEVDAGGNLSNTVTADSVESAPATSSLNIPITQIPSIHVVKSSTTATVTAAGQVVPYTFTVTNTGNVTLMGITITDPKCAAAPVLSAGDGNADGRIQLAEMWVYGCSHTVTQAEIDAGGNLSNTVTVDSVESAPDTSTLNIPVTQGASIHVVKSSTTASVTAPGQAVPYTFTVTNTGNVTLTGITVSDPKCNAAPALSAGDANADSKLQLGETWVYGCTHTVTVAEMNAGGNLSNTVTADSVESAPATSTLNIPVTQSPAIDLVKVAVLDGTVVAPPGTVDAGDHINYTLTATNTGNVSLTGVTITDPMLGALACVPAQPSTLVPGATLTCTASHTITVGDVTTGHVDNTATTSGTAPDASTVSDTASVTEALSPAPSLAIVKSALPTTYDHVGQMIAYSYQVTNDGNTTLFGPFSVTDNVTTNESCPPQGALAPAASITCTSSYAITQADLDAGWVTNIAFASNASVTSPTDTVTVNAIQSPQVALAKNGVLVTTVVAPAGRVDAGDRVDYTLTATNTGNLTLHGVTIADAKLGALTCVQPVTLAPGASLACTGLWTVTQADIDAGQVDNTGTADTVETPPVSTPETVVLPQVRSLSLVKTVQQVGFTAAGDPLDYRYRVTNTGNTSLAGPVSVIDDTTAVTCPSVTTVGDNDAALDPGEVIECTASYVVTAANVTAGLVTNIAQASAAGTLSNVGSVTVDKLSVVADLAVTKTSAPNPYVAGGALTWTVRVTNNGPSPVVGASVADTVPAALTGVTWTCAVTTGTGSCGAAAGIGNAISTTVNLANNAVATYTITGTVNPATVGTLANTAVVTTPLGVLDPKPGNNVATDANAAVPALADAAIAIAPGASSVSPSAALSFDVTVSNNGPAAADGVKTIVSIPPGYGFVSASGGGWACSLSVNLVVCQLAGQLASGATAPTVALALVGPAGVGHTTLNASVATTTTDTNPTNDDAAAGVDVTSPPIPPPVGPQADLALAKSASPATAATGDRITYTVTTTNNGPDAASSVVVTDTLPAGVSFVSASGAGWSCAPAGNVVTCSTPALASGASAAFQVVVTAAAPGTQVNAASVGSATSDPNLANNTATASTSVAARADLAVTKTASAKTFVIGRPLVFTVTVANYGPDLVTGARVQDAVPANLGSVTWTCAAVSGTCAASGTGAIDQLVDIAAGGRVVFTVKGTPAAGAPTTIANTASVAPPTGATDPNEANNTATASVKRTVGPTVLRVLITPKVATLTSGVPVQATVTTTNVGVEAANGVITCISLPPGITVAQPAGGFPRSNAYCWTRKQLAPKGKVRYRVKLRGDRQLAARVRLVAVAQAGNAPRVNDKSRLIVKKGHINGIWVFTG